MSCEAFDYIGPELTGTAEVSVLRLESSMNRATLVASLSLAKLVRFDHPGTDPHVDPAEECPTALSLSFIEQGVFTVAQGRREWRLDERTLFLTVPGRAYTVRHASPAPEDVCLCVELGDHAANVLAQSMERVAALSPSVALTPRLAYLQWCLSRREAGRESLADDVLVTELLDAACEAAGRQPTTVDPFRVAAQARRVIEIKDGHIVTDRGTTAPPPGAAAALQRRTTHRASAIPDTIEAGKMALRALRANLMRTLLTLLGIIIGVASVVAMLRLLRLGGRGCRVRTSACWARAGCRPWVATVRSARTRTAPSRRPRAWRPGSCGC